MCLQRHPLRAKGRAGRPPQLAKIDVERTANTQTATIQNVGVQHRRRHVAVPQQLLHRPDVITGFKQVRGKGMTKCVARNPVRDLGGLSGDAYCTLKYGRMDVRQAALIAGDM